MSERTYSIFSDGEYRALVINCPLVDIPFNVWRALARKASFSISSSESEILRFTGKDLEERLSAAEQILLGALFIRKK